MRNLARICLKIALLLTLLVGPAKATKIVPMDARKLGETATTVVLGKVSSVHSFWNTSHTKVFTETLVTVDEAFKGDPGSTVRLIQLGGEVDGIRVTVHGALHWTQGEEVLLFLEPYRDGAYHVTGFSQGKYHIERDEATGRAFVRQANLGEVEVHGEDGHDDEARMTPAKKVSLDHFIASALPRPDNQGQR